MSKKIITFLQKNLTVIMFFIFSILIEVIAVYSIEKTPFISHPWIWLGFLILISGCMIMTKSELARLIIGLIFMIIQSVVCMIMAILYEMAGQYFDFGMLNLRNDAFGILENIPMDFVTFYTAFFFCMIFTVSALRRRKRRAMLANTADSDSVHKSAINNNRKENHLRLITGALIAATGLFMAVFSIYQNNKDKSSFYDNLKTSTDKSVYSSYGINGNLINEFAGGLIFTNKETLSDDKIEDFIYSEVSAPTDYFGVSKDNNVVVILVESLEWFGMMKNDILPNALPLTDEQYAELFPNLTAFYNSSVVMTDFHSKEKTDISETMSILGSYPTRGYINYDVCILSHLKLPVKTILLSCRCHRHRYRMRQVSLKVRAC